MTILRSGPTRGYSDNWAKAFGKKKKKAAPKAEAKVTKKKKAKAKKPAKKG